MGMLNQDSVVITNQQVPTGSMSASRWRQVQTGPHMPVRAMGNAKHCAAHFNTVDSEANPHLTNVETFGGLRRPISTLWMPSTQQALFS